MKKSTPNLDIDILGYYQLIGGLIGIAGVLFTFLSQVEQNSIFLGLVLMLPFTLSIYAGIQCIKNKPNKLRISRYNQILQVLSFSLFGFGFTYHSGVYFSLGVKSGGTFLFDLGISSVNFVLNSFSEASFMSINLVAFYLVYRIIDAENLIEEERGESNNLEDHLIP